MRHVSVSVLLIFMLSRVSWQNIALHLSDVSQQLQV